MLYNNRWTSETMFEIRVQVNLYFLYFKNTAILRNLDGSSVCVSTWMKEALHKGNRTLVPYFGMYLLWLLQGQYIKLLLQLLCAFNVKPFKMQSLIRF